MAQQRNFIHIQRMAGDLQPAGNLIVTAPVHHQLRRQRKIQQRQRPRSVVEQAVRA
jgi:hypothetical protein